MSARDAWLLFGCRQDASTPESGKRGPARGESRSAVSEAARVPPGAQRNVAGAKMAAGQGGGRRGVSHRRAGAGQLQPYLDVRMRRLPLVAG